MQDQELEAAMWHGKRWFGGGWVIWVIFFLFFSGIMGKGGFPGFVIPMILFWVFVPMLFGGKKPHRPADHRTYRPAQAGERTSEKQAVSNAPQVPDRTIVDNTNTRSLAGLPGHCRSCGGPVDETTVRWRGSYPACGFCGTGLKYHG